MKSKILVYFFVVTIMFESLFSSVESKFAIGTFDDWIAKRSYQRRSFLKSFCARRCNIGQGGNVCKCNGFHFAGKRSEVGDSLSVLRSDEQTTGVDDPPTTDVIYKMLEDNDRLVINNDQYGKGDGQLVQRTYKPAIDTMYPAYRKQSTNNRFDPGLDLLLRTYMYNEEQ